MTMLFRLMTLAVLFVSFSALAVGRGPAVEDFIGIEVDHVESTPHGTDSLYNLETDMNEVKAREQKANKDKFTPPPAEFAWDPITVSLGITLALLPMFACLFVMRKLRNKATIESASNIEVLEKYRKERESRKNQEIKKVA